MDEGPVLFYTPLLENLKISLICINTVCIMNSLNNAAAHLSGKIESKYHPSFGTSIYPLK